MQGRIKMMKKRTRALKRRVARVVSVIVAVIAVFILLRMHQQRIAQKRLKEKTVFSEELRELLRSHLIEFRSTVQEWWLTDTSSIDLDDLRTRMQTFNQAFAAYQDTNEYTRVIHGYYAPLYPEFVSFTAERRSFIGEHPSFGGKEPIFFLSRVCTEKYPMLVGENVAVYNTALDGTMMPARPMYELILAATLHHEFMHKIFAEQRRALVGFAEVTDRRKILEEEIWVRERIEDPILARGTNGAFPRLVHEILDRRDGAILAPIRILDLITIHDLRRLNAMFITKEAPPSMWGASILMSRLMESILLLYADEEADDPLEMKIRTWEDLHNLPS